MRPGKPQTILIADDSESVRTVIRESLERETGFKIFEVTDGIGAVAKAKELMPDLAILDVRMPQLNGVEVIILVSMYGDDLGKKLTSAIRVDAILSKADGTAALIETVENLLAH